MFFLGTTVLLPSPHSTQTNIPPNLFYLISAPVTVYVVAVVPATTGPPGRRRHAEVLLLPNRHSINNWITGRGTSE